MARKQAYRPDPGIPPQEDRCIRKEKNITYTNKKKSDTASENEQIGTVPEKGKHKTNSHMQKKNIVETKNTET